MKCPNDRILIAFTDGELPLRKHEAVARHADECEVCRRRIEELNALKSLVSEEKRAEVSAEEVRRFVSALPSRKRVRAGDWPRVVLAPALAAALLLGMFVGRAFFAEERIVEVVKPSGLPGEEIVPALAALQRVKLVDGAGLFAEDIRRVEELVCDSVMEGEGAKAARAIRLICEAEDAAAENNFAGAASVFKEAAEVAGETDIGAYARLQGARVLAQGLGLYGAAMEELAELRAMRVSPVVEREADYLLATCEIALGDTWGAGATLEALARAGGADDQLARLASELGDVSYEEGADLETAQRAYAIWREATPVREAVLQRAREVDRRLALLEESADERWEPLRLYLRAEKARPTEAQYLYEEVVGEYPESSLADAAFVKWYGLEQARRARSRPKEWPAREVPGGELAHWETVLESDAPQEIRAYARLKIADRLHDELDGAEEVLLAYSNVFREYPWTSAADVARERADDVREMMERKIIE